MEPTADVLLLLLLMIFLIVLFFIGHFSSGQVKVMVSLPWMMDQRFRGGPETYVRGRVFGKQQFLIPGLEFSLLSQQNIRVWCLSVSVHRSEKTNLKLSDFLFDLLINVGCFWPQSHLLSLGLVGVHSGQGSPLPPSMLPKTLQLSSAVLDFDCFILVGC